MTTQHAGDPEAEWPESVPILNDGEPAAAATVAPALEGHGDRTAILDRQLTLMRVTNWGVPQQMSATAYSPIDVAYDPALGRWFVLHHNASPAGYHVSTSADGATWTVEEHDEVAYQLRTLCADSGLADGVLVGGVSGNITQRVTSPLAWTDRVVTNLQDCFQIVWDPTSKSFVAVGQDTGSDPGVWTSDDGTTWTQQTVPAQGEAEIKGVTTSRTGKMVAWTDGSYWTSSDGVTWTAAGSTPNTPDNIAVTESTDANGAEVWLMLTGTAYEVSTDDGATWTPLSTGALGDNDISGLVAIRNVFVATNVNAGTTDQTDLTGRLYYSKDFGATWQSVSFARVLMNWPGPAPVRRQLHKTSTGRLAVLGCDATVAGRLYLTQGLAFAGGDMFA
jgi:hypothetical protein